MEIALNLVFNWGDMRIHFKTSSYFAGDITRLLAWKSVSAMYAQRVAKPDGPCFVQSIYAFSILKFRMLNDFRYEVSDSVWLIRVHSAATLCQV